MSSPLVRPCPCPSGLAYDACCGPLHRGEAQAGTAVALLRARYAAYAVGAADYVFATWHPRTRPAEVHLPDPGLWRGLQVLEQVDGGPDDEDGVVEFVAHRGRDALDGSGTRRERSRFTRRAGRWLYLDGTTS